MPELQLSPENYRREFLVYRWLPTVLALTLVGIFISSVVLSGNYVLSTLCTVVPTVFILLRWIQAGRRIDRWGCPNCRQPFAKKMTWTFPPSACPHCGKAIKNFANS
jgi:hypothetical protein